MVNFQPPRYAYEPKSTRRARALSELQKVSDQISPLVAQGDTLSLQKARNIVEGAESDTPKRKIERSSAIRQAIKQQFEAQSHTQEGQGFLGSVFGALDRPRQASLGFFTGSNPIDSISQAVRGALGQERFSGEDVGFVRHLPEDSRIRDAAGAVAEEVLDPLNLGLAAAGGAAPVAALRNAGAVGRAAARVAEPVIQGGYRSRLGGEVAASLGARFGSERAQELLPKDAPDALRTGVSLAGGILGGGATSLGLGAGLRAVDPKLIESGPEALASGAARRGLARQGRAPISGGAMAATAPNIGSRVGVPGRFVSDKTTAREIAAVAPDKLGELFGMRDVPAELGRADRVKNIIRDTLGQNVTDEQVTPFMRERARLLDRGGVVDSYANEVGLVSDVTLSRAFDLDGVTVPSLAQVEGSAPTIADIAAKLPLYEPHLSAEQIAALREVEGELRPLYEALTEQGIDIHSRADVMGGGFYIPRGKAELPGEQVVRSGRGGRAGSRKGFEKSATFESQAAGVAAGFDYQSPGEAIRDYVRAAGERAIDARTTNYLKTLRDAEGNLIAQTAADRIDPDLKAQVETLRAKIAGRAQTIRNQGIRATAQEAEAARANRLSAQADEAVEGAFDRFTRLDDTDATFRAAKRELEILERESRRAEGRAGTALNRAEATNARQSDTLAELKRLRDEYSQLKGRWENNKRQAASAPRGESSIDISGLQGYSFPDRIAAAANMELEKSRPLTGRGATPIKAVNAANRLLRGLNATLDASFMGIQGLLGAVNDPGAYRTAMGTVIESMRDPQALGSYLRTKDPEIVKQMVRDGVRIGSSNTEFAIGRGMGKVSSLIEDADWAKGINPVRGSNRLFGTFGDVMRIELYESLSETAAKAGLDLSDPSVRASIANSANMMTGTGSRSFLGDEIGGLVTFAPRFFQSQLDLVGKALTDGNLEGALARRTFTRLLGGAAALTVGANTLLGEETDFNPTSPNFLRIRVAGNDVSLLGPWDSLIRAAMNTAQGDFEYLPRSKASPILRAAWDLIAGEDAIGNDTRNPGYLASMFVPFSLQGALGQNPLQTAVGLSGLKATPMSPTDRLNAHATMMFGSKFYDLEPNQKQAIKGEHPELWQEAVAKGSDKRQQAETVRSFYRDQQEAADAKLLSGEMNREDWMDAYYTRLTEKRAKLEQIYGSDSITKPKNPVEKYIQILQRAEDPTTGQLDRDLVDAGLDSLTKDERDYIDRNIGLDDTPLGRAFREVRKVRSGKFELPKYHGYTADEANQIDELWQEARNNARSAEELDMRRALRQVLAGSSYPDEIVRGVQRRISGRLPQTRDRDRFDREHPETALFYGRGRLTEGERAVIEEMAS